MELNSLLNSHTVYTDGGWGVDVSWLSLLFHEADVVQRFRLESIYALLREDQIDQWPEHRARVLELTGMEPHRAGTDALIVKNTFSYAMDPERFEEEHCRRANWSEGAACEWRRREPDSDTGCGHGPGRIPMTAGGAGYSHPGDSIPGRALGAGESADGRYW